MDLFISLQIICCCACPVRTVFVCARCVWRACCWTSLIKIWMQKDFTLFVFTAKRFHTLFYCINLLIFQVILFLKLYLYLRILFWKTMQKKKKNYSSLFLLCLSGLHACMLCVHVYSFVSLWNWIFLFLGDYLQGLNKPWCVLITQA